jgi:hypothetical protein
MFPTYDRRRGGHALARRDPARRHPQGTTAQAQLQQAAARAQWAEGTGALAARRAQRGFAAGSSRNTSTTPTGLPSPKRTGAPLPWIGNFR